MIYNILGRLFKTDPYDFRYVPKPQHAIYSILLMAVGTAVFSRDGWWVFGTLTILIGFMLGVVINIAIGWEKSIEYWSTINEHIKLMMKVKDPDLWVALGYKHVPQTVQVFETENTGQGFITTRIKDIPIPVGQMNLLANKVLTSGKTTFSESEYSALVPNFRSIQKKWRKDGILKANNSKNPRLGFSFSKKGIDMLYEFASDTIKLKEAK
jgi:hypothetical protein